MRPRAMFLSGQVALSQGDASTARLLLEESLALYRDLGDRQRMAQVLVGLAKVEAYQGDLATARILYEESLSLARVGYKLDLASGLEGLANVVAAQGKFTWAARLWGAAEALRDTMGAPLPLLERPDYEQGRDAMQRHQGLPGAWATLDQQHPRGAADQGTSEAGRHKTPPFRATTACSADGSVEPLWQLAAQILLI